MDSASSACSAAGDRFVGPLYIVTERFDPGRGDDWQKYISWSGLTQLHEVVSLDSILCPKVIDEILPEDWHHIVNEDFMLDYFTDLDYLLQRARRTGRAKSAVRLQEPGR